MSLRIRKERDIISTIIHVSLPGLGTLFIYIDKLMFNMLTVYA